MTGPHPRGLGVFVLLALQSVFAMPVAAVDLDALFRDAWIHSPAARLSAQTLVQASWTKDCAERQWLPSLSVGREEEASPLVLLQGSDAGRSVSGALGLSLAQRLPGGGLVTLRGTMTKNWMWISSLDSPLSGTWTPGVSLDLRVPLMANPTQEIAPLTYQLEVLLQQEAQREAVLELLRTASKLDLARQTLAWSRAVEAVAVGEVDDIQELVRVGRGSVMDSWKVQRRARVAHWDRVQAEAALQSAEDGWRRTTRQEFPWFDTASLEAYSERQEGAASSLDEQIFAVRKALDQLQARVERSLLAPTLRVDLSGSRVSDPDRTWGGSLDLSLGADFWVLGAAIEGRSTATERRWDLLAETTRHEKQDQRELWERQSHEVRTAREQLVPGLQRLRETRDTIHALVLREAATRGEVLAVEAEVLALELDRRKLAWQSVELSFQLGPPPWAFR